MDRTNKPARWRQPFSWVLIGFLAAGGFLLFTEHRAHVLGVLPFLLLLLCPVMPLFMHHGHGGHGGQRRNADDRLNETHHD